MVERGLNANHSIITEFICEHKEDSKNIGDIIFKPNDWIDYLQAQVYDLQNKKFEDEAKFKGMSLAANFRSPKTYSSLYDGKPMPCVAPRLRKTGTPCIPAQRSSL